MKPFSNSRLKDYVQLCCDYLCKRITSYVSYANCYISDLNDV